MQTIPKIRTVIIDDDKTSIRQLSNELETFQHIELVRTCNNPHQAASLIIETRPDLVFMDVEMPGKTGFDVLRDLRNEQPIDTQVIFYTAYEKYVLQALREAAFDFLLKPAKYAEICLVLNRYMAANQAPPNPCNQLNHKIDVLLPQFGQRILLPTSTGYRFVYHEEILLFRHDTSLFSKASWSVVLTDKTVLRLKSSTNATDICKQLHDINFFQVNQSAILNLRYLCAIDASTKRCVLIHPFDKEQVVLSRNAYDDLRKRFDML
jgi:two-component system LytT family response regulator